MASTDHREAAPPVLSDARSRPSLAGAAAILLAVGIGIYLLYFLAYPVRHLTLPVGFDPPWYVWRAERLTSLGVGTGPLAARPGYAVLSAVLGSLTGLSPLETTVVLSMILVSLLAMGVGAFARAGLGFDRWRWALIMVTAGVVIGPTHLVGENLSNTLNIALEIGALAALVGFVGGGRGLTAAVLLLLASGLVHWDFVALFAVVMAVAFVMALPSSARERRAGVPLVRTESGALAALGAWMGGILLVVVGAVLRAPFRTMEMGNDELLFRRKFRTDVARLFVPAVAGLVGPSALFREDRAIGASGPDASESSERRRRAFAVRLLRAWTWVMAAGMVVGLVTFSVPPARFLAHLVAFPGAITVGAVLAVLAMQASRSMASSRAGNARWSRILPVGIIALALAALAVPGLLRWYRYPVLLEPAALQQARTADRYLGTLPAHRPVVFLIDYEGRPGSLSAVMKERTIRLGLSPQRQLDAHIFVGTLPDLLRGQRTPAPDERAARFTRRYWEDVRPVLIQRSPIVILRAMAGAGYREAVSMGGRVVAPGVAVLRGPPPPALIQPAAPPHETPSLPAGVAYGLIFLALLCFAGVGWTRTLLGPERPPETVAAMAPVLGSALLVVGGLAAAELGVRLGPAGAWGTYLTVAISGLVAARLAGRRSAGGPPAL